MLTHYQPPRTVAQFMASDARYRCIVGPVGSGKTTGCLMELLVRSMQQKPGRDGVRRTRWALVRSTYRELRDTLRRSFEQWVPRDVGVWREGDFSFTLRIGDAVAEFMFRSLDQPDDIRKLLSLELTGAYVNEGRELAKPLFDALTGRCGRYPAMTEGGPTWRGIIMDSNPWHDRHHFAKLFASGDSRFQLFRQPGGRSPLAENLTNLIPDYYSDLLAGKSSDWIKVYVDGQDSDGALGSIYGAQLAALRARGGVSAFEHGTADTLTVWDLGVGDATAILWFQFNKDRGVDVVDWYENSGQPLSHYFEVVDRKPYKYVQHLLPHDARARTLQTGRSTIELVEEHWSGKVSLVPRLDVEQGIESARWLLEQPSTRFHSRCDVVPPDREFSGLDLLGEYKFEFDETKRVYGRAPLHNYASHTSDAFRYLAVSARNAEQLSRPEGPRVVKAKGWLRPWGSFTMDDMWKQHESDLRRRDNY